MSKSFEQHWKQRIESAEFKKSLQILEAGLWDELGQRSLKEVLGWLQNALKENLGDEEAPARKAAAKLVHNLHWRFLYEMAPKLPQLQQSMDSETLHAWREVSTTPVELPEETVREIVDQEAIRQLFANVIHEAIVSFNKKFNPFFGAVNALGFSDQIRDFLQPFMGQVTQMAANFITNPDNQGMFQDFAGDVFDIISEQDPSVIKELPLESWDVKAHDAIQRASQDTILNEVVYKTLHEYIESLKKEYPNDDVKTFLERWELSLKPSQGDQQAQLHQFLKESETLKAFLEREFEAYNKS